MVITLQVPQVELFKVVPVTKLFQDPTKMIAISNTGMAELTDLLPDRTITDRVKKLFNIRNYP